ncbi:MAG: DUF177 domain-containing protein [Pseudomonadota bacterium]
MIEAGPWPYPLAWRDAANGVASLRLVADPLALSRIAAFLDLESLQALAADLTIRPWRDGIEISGRIDGRATRICGLTLEAFDAGIAEDLRVRIVPPGSPNAARGADPNLDPDTPDERVGDAVDVGAYVVEHLALALDPFPRKPGAVFEPPEPTGPASPFAALAGRARPPSAD